ncbi:TetR/AcrR family transcriptional regulator [Lactiplantibacillus pingfangensis]|uniref:TetR/AcrR family transcriptional regulator n=1 Tax=Lactiplantibacillus pingfangensis TaxID=2559915 RepID=UPI0010F5C368|nr:TetR/AcrR family transcriptional regulator [Lactiplantibacillus pingfangensis]
MEGHAKIAQQSRTWIIDAFFELLSEQSYEALTVKAIADRAQLSRRTFYRFFEDKAAILDYLGQQFLADYAKKLQGLNPETVTFDEIVVLFFRFMWDRRLQLRLLIQQNLFMRQLPKAITKAPKLYQKFEAPWHHARSVDQVELLMTFMLGGYWGVINGWLAQEQPAPPEEMANNLLLTLKNRSLRDSVD